MRALTECLFVAQSGRTRRRKPWQLSRVKRTRVRPSRAAANDPKRTCKGGQLVFPLQSVRLLTLGTRVLCHQSGFFVFEDVAVIHEGVLPCRWPIEGDQKFGLILDEHRVFPACQICCRRCSLDR